MCLLLWEERKEQFPRQFYSEGTPQTPYSISSALLSGSKGTIGIVQRTEK